jgi:acetyl esterase/lipase
VPEDDSILTRAASSPDEVIAYGKAPEQVADVRQGGERAGRRPLVLIIHGGFWRPDIDRTHTGPMAEALASAGWTVAAVEYRRTPGDPDLTVHDIALSLKTLPAKVARHDGRVLMIGHSAGGHLALWAASKRPIPELHGALALAPAADLQLAQRLNLGEGATLAFLGVEPNQRADLDPKQLPSPAIGVTIVHGADDDVVPFSVSESYVAAHPRARLVNLPDAGHFAPIDPDTAAWATVVSELECLARQVTMPSPR